MYTDESERWRERATLRRIHWFWMLEWSIIWHWPVKKSPWTSTTLILQLMQFVIASSFLCYYSDCCCCCEPFAKPLLTFDLFFLSRSMQLMWYIRKWFLFIASSEQWKNGRKRLLKTNIHNTRIRKKFNSLKWYPNAHILKKRCWWWWWFCGKQIVGF